MSGALAAFYEMQRKRMKTILGKELLRQRQECYEYEYSVRTNLRCKVHLDLNCVKTWKPSDTTTAAKPPPP